MLGGNVRSSILTLPILLYVSTVMRALKEIGKGSNRPFVTSSPSNGL